MEKFQLIYTAEGLCIDVEGRREDGTAIRMLGPAGAERELAVLAPLYKALDEAANTGEKLRALPVLLGSGLGYALKALEELSAKHGFAFAVVDKETDLRHMLACAMPGHLENAQFVENAEGTAQAENPEHAKAALPYLRIEEENAQMALGRLTQWQMAQGGMPFLPLAHPFYARIAPAYYQFLRDHAKASAKFDFWGKARKKRFAGKTPRILLITSRYFLIGEVAEAADRLGINTRLLSLRDDEMASTDFVETLLKEVLEFEPDMVLTLNHLGVDKEGILTNLLEKLELPLASWFVDNPHLVLHLYQGLASPWVCIFTWDKDNIAPLKAQGFPHVWHLPLGTAPTRFKPQKTAVPQEWAAPVSFVGNSMYYKVGQRMKKGRFAKPLLLHYKELARDFAQSPETSMPVFLEKHPVGGPLYASLTTTESRLAFETLLTWESTRLYRLQCVQGMMQGALQEGAMPLIVGDEGWHVALRKESRPFRWLAPLAYYDELPRFYPHSAINFNATSMQMKGAVNQRVFDVPAAGAFLLTDARAQMPELFEPEEMATYTNPAEIPDLITRFSKFPKEREAFIQAGRARVLSCHTWEHRLAALMSTMRSIYG